MKITGSTGALRSPRRWTSQGPSRRVYPPAPGPNQRPIIEYDVPRIQGKVTSNSPAVQRQVRYIQAHIQNGRYGAAGARYHSLNFRYVRQAQAKGFLRNLNREPRITAPASSAVRFRKPDFRFDGGGIYDLKPFRSSPNAYDATLQFQDIFDTTGQMPVPLYYRRPR